MKLAIGKSTIGTVRADARKRAGGMFLILALALSGCSNFEMPKFGLGKKKPVAETNVDTAATSIKLVERDVEAPSVFQVTEAALWDGRPSLGGVWVAYPGQVQPERVIIRNEENKKFVIGALFRRERKDPGPKIQLSSDAAAALGILAGKPTILNVTALRRESVAAAPPDTSQPASKAKTATSKKPKKGSVQSIAAAAIDKAAGNAAKKAKKPAKTAASTGVKRPKPISSLAKPYIQIGIFSIETNANNTATSLRTQGVVPIIKAQTSRGKKFWRVLVGPASSKSERSILLKKARLLGFGDAYFVTN